MTTKHSPTAFPGIASRLMRIAIVGLLGVVTAGSLSPARAAGLLLADGGLGGALEIEEHSVHVTFNNGVAVTDVTQVFRNLENRQVEALYTFPVPRGASVSNFSMWIGGKEVVGEVVEKRRAREIYETYKARRIDPGILEQVDFKTFEMRIFPIAPNAEQRVQVTYYQEIDHDNDWATYVYPLATTTHKDVSSRTRGKFAFTADLKSAVPIAAVESPSHGADMVISQPTPEYARSSLEATGGDLNRDLVLAMKLSRPRTGIDWITSRPRNEDGYFLMTVTVGEELAPLDHGMDYVFVLDVSGSMANDGKLNLSRSSLAAFVEALDEKDRLEVIAFNVEPKLLFKVMSPISVETRKQAVGFIEAQTARGGTYLKPALEAAYKYHDPSRELVVVVLSDGMTEQAERAVLEPMIRQRPPSTRVFCIGVGNEVNRGLLTDLAEGAGGLAAFLSRGDDFQRQAVAFQRKLMRPVATDIEVKFDGVEVHDLEPRVLPSLYHGAPIRLYGRFKQSGKAELTLRAKVSGRELKQNATIEFPREDDSNPQIERMWAYRKVERLLREAQRGAGATAIEEIVRLSEAYSIANEYASFLVLENDREFQRWQIARRNVVRLGRDRGAREQLLAQLETLRDSSLAAIGPEAAANVRLAAAPPAVPTPNLATAPPVGSRPAAPPPARERRGRGLDLNFGSGPVGPLFAVLGALLLRRKRRPASTCSSNEAATAD